MSERIGFQITEQAVDDAIDRLAPVQVPNDQLRAIVEAALSYDPSNRVYGLAVVLLINGVDPSTLLASLAMADEARRQSGIDDPDGGT
jgi:hypothetical protein